MYHDRLPPGATGDRRYAFKTDIFRALVDPLRIQLLEILVAGERSVQELQQALGLDQLVVSRHLAVLRVRRIVEARRDGTAVCYAVRDPLNGQLLEVARRAFNDELAGARDMPGDLPPDRRRRRRAPGPGDFDPGQPALCRRLLGRLVSESGRLCHGAGGHVGGACGRRACRLTSLLGLTIPQSIMERAD